MNDRIKASLKSLGKTISDKNADAIALYVRDTSNIFWLTAFDDVFDDESAHGFFISEDSAVLHTDLRYSNACKCAAKDSSSGIEIDDDPIGHAQFLEKQIKNHNVKCIAIEDGISVFEYDGLKAITNECAIYKTHELVKRLRSVKDVSEVARIKHAQSIADSAFTHIIEWIKPGVTQRQVAYELDCFIQSHGSEGLAFTTIVASGEDSSNPHAKPTDDVLQDGQCVVMDFGARWMGYCCDMTRTVFLGHPSQQMKDAYQTLQEISKRVEDMLKQGVEGADAHQLAEDILGKSGFGGRMGHGLGHGVGIDVHEYPTLSPKSKDTLQSGNIVTVEPGIYIPGQFGMRLEDMGLITTDGFDVFTQSTHDMVII